MSRKEAILIAAVTLFAERGFAATPTSAIARKAGVAEGLVFHHFKNKVGILVQILMDLVSAYLQEVTRRVEAAPCGLDALEAAIQCHFEISGERCTEFSVLVRDFPMDLIGSDSPTGRMLAEALLRPPELIGRCIERGMGDGSIRKVPVDETVDIVLGLLNGVARLPIDMPAVHPARNLGAEVVRFCRRSLAAPSGKGRSRGN